ncbi:hypothetical protein PINS_up006138 [Pythium insidiosum]|nr:hypothetical protein PINS_up006138 [Pythium insidiosum]
MPTQPRSHGEHLYEREEERVERPCVPCPTVAEGARKRARHAGTLSEVSHPEDGYQDDYNAQVEQSVEDGFRPYEPRQAHCRLLPIGMRRDSAVFNGSRDLVEPFPVEFFRGESRIE